MIAISTLLGLFGAIAITSIVLSGVLISQRTSTPTFESLSITDIENQLILAGAFTTVISVTPSNISTTLIVPATPYPYENSHFVLDTAGELIITNLPDLGTTQALMPTSETTAEWTTFNMSSSTYLTLPEAANTVFAGPPSGGPQVAAFRTLILADLPVLNDGELYVGSTGSSVVANTLTGTSNQIVVTNGPGSITLNLPQDINTTSSPTFTSIKLGIATIAASVPGAARTYTISDPGANASIPTSLNVPSTAGEVLTSINASAAQWVTPASASLQTAKTFFAGPNIGPAALPTFRAFAYTDLPSATDGQVLAWDTVSTAWVPTGNPIYYGLNTQANSGNNTVVIGANASAVGLLDSIVIGHTAITSGARTVAIGPNAFVLASNNVAIGYQVASQSDNSVVLGPNAGAQSISFAGGSVVIGSGSVGTDDPAVAIGSSASSTKGGIGIGLSASAGSQYSMAFGRGASTGTVGDYAIAYGAFSISNDSSCVAVGSNTQCLTQNAVVMGTYAQNTYLAANSVAIGQNATSNVASGVAIGDRSTTNGILGSVSIGLLSSPLDTSHALAFGLNVASTPAGSIGATINGVARTIPTWPSLYLSLGGAGPYVMTTTNVARRTFFTTAQTVNLPFTSTLQQGWSITIVNLSVGNVVVQNSHNLTKVTLATMTAADLICQTVGDNTTAAWVSIVNTGPISAT